MTRSIGKIRKILLHCILVFGLLFAEQMLLREAFAQGNEEDEISDPLESGNRGFFDFFMLGYYVVIHPLIGIYNGVVPQVARDRLDDFAGFTRMPVTLINDGLQGNFDGGIQSTTIRTAKSAVTIGLYDFDRRQSPRRFEDYGQTLGVYGVGEGPFVIFPLAPNTRDLTAYIAQSIVLDPLSYILAFPIRIGLLGVRLTSIFSNIDRVMVSIFRNVDGYAVARNGFVQQRRVAILNRGRVDEEELEKRQENFDLEIDEELLEEVYE